VDDMPVTQNAGHNPSFTVPVGQTANFELGLRTRQKTRL